MFQHMTIEYTFQKEESLREQTPSQTQQPQLQLQSTILHSKYGISYYRVTQDILIKSQKLHQMIIKQKQLVLP